MAFDWSEYDALADRLRISSDEASQRTVVSRLYYSAFHQARLYLEGAGYTRSAMGPGSHQQLWNEFRRRGRSHHPISSIGNRLLGHRVRADYEDQIDNLDELVEESFKATARILAYLKQIQSAKNPGQS